MYPPYQQEQKEEVKSLHISQQALDCYLRNRYGKTRFNPAKAWKEGHHLKALNEMDVVTKLDSLFAEGKLIAIGTVEYRE